MSIATRAPFQRTYTPVELLPALLAHDEAAWTEFSEWATPLIRGHCRKCGLVAADADAVVQEVLVIVYRRLDTFRQAHQPGAFRRWLWRITHHEVLRLLGQPRPVLLDPAELECWPTTQAGAAKEDPASSAREEQRRSAFAQVRAEFGEAGWQAFLLVSVKGWTAAKAGAALGMSASAVRMVKCRIRRRLSELLGK